MTKTEEMFYIVEILKKHSLSVKWKNFRKWQKEDIKSLHDAFFNRFGFNIGIEEEQLCVIKGKLKIYLTFEYAEWEIYSLICGEYIKLGDMCFIESAKYSNVKIGY